MSKWLLVIPVIFVWILSVSAQNETGRDIIEHYYSSALEKGAECRVFLPPGYDSNDINTRYPVIYLLHGASSGYESFDLLLPAVDGFWNSGYIKPFIMVMPDGRSEPYLGSFYTNSVLYGNYEDFIFQDLIPFIDSTYNTLAQKSFRAIWGVSMGAYGAFKQVFKHPEYYTAIAAHSGPVNFDLLVNLIPDLKEEQGNQAPYDWHFESGKGLTNLMISMAGAFSPNLEADNLVDFPLDDQGDMIPEVMEKWKPHNISQLANSFGNNKDISIYFDCGIQDEYKLIHHNRALSDTLTKYNIQHEFKEYFGNHTSGLVFRIPIALKFFDNAFGSVINSIEAIDKLPEDLVRVYVNPSSRIVNIDWQSGTTAEASFYLIDALGRVKHEGLIHSEETFYFDSNSFPPGLYFVSINYNHIKLISKILIK